MANTTNLDLVKPAGTDKALVSVLNANSDKIDAFAGTTNQALSKVNTVKSITASMTTNDFAEGLNAISWGYDQTIDGVTPANSMRGYLVKVTNAMYGMVTNANGTVVYYIGYSSNAWHVSQDALKSDALLTPTLILEQIPTTSGENTYDCNWAIYKVLIIAIGNYGNIYNTFTVPTSEFSATANGHAIFISYGGGSAWTIYKNGQSGVKIIAPSSIQSNTRIRIWGM